MEIVFCRVGVCGIRVCGIEVLLDHGDVRDGIAIVKLCGHRLMSDGRSEHTAIRPSSSQAYVAVALLEFKAYGMTERGLISP
jgi:hypothetical protein